jgi:hypothetical protein
MPQDTAGPGLFFYLCGLREGALRQLSVPCQQPRVTWVAVADLSTCVVLSRAAY